MKNKKSDKLIIMLIVFIVFFFMSWIIEGGMYNSGEFVATGYVRFGLFDIIVVLFSAFYYKFRDIFYILIVGGCYGVLSQTKIYRKLVDKTANFIKGKEAIVMALLTLLIGAYVSISTQMLALFCITPFIVSVFLRNGYDKVTAINAGFGGMFVGYLGLTFGTFGVTKLNEVTGLGITDWIWVKVAIFAAAYILFTLFAILHMNKNNDEDETKSDIFCPEELNETKIKNRHRVKIWPIVVVSIIGLITLLLGYIDWVASFGVKLFTEFHTELTTGFRVANVPIFGTLLGSYATGLGEWTDLITASLVVLVGTIIISLIGKINFNDFCKYFGRGMKKISKVAFIYGLACSLLFLATSFPWQNTIINALFGNGSFNIFILLIISIITLVLIGDPEYCGYMFGSYLTVAFADNIIAAGLIWRIGSAIAFVAGPTSFVLLAALTYLDVPYMDWLKYVWKFVLSFILVVLLILALVMYV